MNLRTLLFASAFEFTLIAEAQPTYSGHYDEPWRPAFHFTPPLQWMNDPNGLIFHRGKYHLFYQYYPDDVVWGPMHWGHAESTDLLHWKQLPIALYPDSLGWIFSGSAVIDKGNTAGFGKDAMVAIFTYHNDAIWKSGRKNTESQGMAYSLDEGRTWVKYPGNPVLNNSGEQDFRDPNVTWDKARKRWLMVLAAGDRIKFYSSGNLKHWNFESNFIPLVKTEYGVWECPDLFPMKVEGEEKWILILSQNMNGPNGGSATRYIVGDFDGKSFKAKTEPQWIDFGMDFYAAVTYDNVPGSKRLLLGWMSNWLYATKTPTQVWRSAMALPRELTLVRGASGYRLMQTVIPEFSELLEPVTEVKQLQNDKRSNLDLSKAVIEFDLVPLKGASTVKLSNPSGEYVTLTIDSRIVRLDRSHSGVIDFSPEFSSRASIMTTSEAVRRVQLILDTSSMEVAVNNGQQWMTSQYFPKEKYTTLDIASGGIENLKIWKVKGAWSR